MPCLGDLYATEWMADISTHDPREETLWEDYVRVSRDTNLSQVCVYGDLVGLANASLETFVGASPRPLSSEPLEKPRGLGQGRERAGARAQWGTQRGEERGVDAVDAREATLVSLDRAMRTCGEPGCAQAFANAMANELRSRARVDAQLERLLAVVVAAAPPELEARLASPPEAAGPPEPALCVQRPTLPRTSAAGGAYLDCFERGLAGVAARCETTGAAPDYALDASARLVSSLCAAGVDASTLDHAIEHACEA